MLSDVDMQKSVLEKKQSELDKLHKKQVEQLEQISNLSADEAKAQLVESLKDKAKTDALEIIQTTLKKLNLQQNKMLKRLLFKLFKE